eukprot:GEMP01104389.1.p1 GENE.GEMP01104389.1~~GEMP01104389.1.p1  ORF type:complete len:212 (+),score=22.21 GEMP01104389.1:103-738(+)
MLNVEEFNLPELRLAISFVKEAIRILLHSIILQRAIGGHKVLEPAQYHSDLFDVTYFKVDDREVEQLVESRVRTFCDLFERPSNASPKTAGCLSISFYTMKVKPRGGSFWNFLTTGEEKIVFEHWRIPLTIQPLKKCINPAETLDQEGTLQRVAQEQLRARMLWCIEKVNSKLDHLPPPPQQSTLYNFDITFDDAHWSPRTFGSMMIPYLS